MAFIGRLEPQNPLLSYVKDPDRVIPEEVVRQVQREAEAVKLRNAIIDGRVLPAEPPEKRANEAAEGGAGDGARPDIFPDRVPDFTSRSDDPLACGNLVSSRPASSRALGGGESFEAPTKG